MEEFNISFTAGIIYIVISWFAINYKPAEFWLDLSDLANVCSMCWTWKHIAIVPAIQEPEAEQLQEWGQVYLSPFLQGISL